MKNNKLFVVIRFNHAGKGENIVQVAKMQRKLILEDVMYTIAIMVVDHGRGRGSGIGELSPLFIWD